MALKDHSLDDKIIKAAFDLDFKKHQSAKLLIVQE